MSVVEALAALRDSAALRKQHPNEPWLWRRDWAERQVRESARVATGCLWVFGLLWLAMSLPMSYSILARGPRQPLLLLFALFPLAGVAILLTAAYYSLRRHKYGVSLCSIDRVPLALGRPFRGEVTARMADRPAEGYRVTLSNIRRVVTGSGKSTSTREDVLWQETQTISAGAVAPSPVGVRIPFTFQLPRKGEPCDTSKPRESVLWRLTVNAEVTGVDYDAMFELPVFRVDEATGGETVEEWSPQSAPLIAWLPTPESGITTRFVNGREEIVIEPRRKAGEWFGFALFLVVWFGISGAIAFVPRNVPFLLFGAIFGLMGILVLVLAIDFLIGRSALQVDRATLSWRRSWFFLGHDDSVAANEIETFAPRVGMTMNGRAFYDLEARLHTGRPRTVAKGFRDRRDAEMLAARLWRSLGKPTTSSYSAGK
ncbi:MAG TPA: hypothetical protein VFN10_09390 [Thermoanaerobaculia bacterium]|nr:hypothetical protein [Thermoanaerobaculia bacterium]